MTLSNVLSWTILLFPVSEVLLALRRRASRADSGRHDRGSLVALWVVITLAVTASILLQGVAWARLPWRAGLLDPIALVLLLGGLALRWTAILTLGRHFTVNVAIARDHRLVRSGPYRLVRHPSYTGLLVAFLGMGLAFHSWLSLAVLLLPVSAALAHRIAVEERALREAFGAEYDEWAARTWRLVPWIH